MQFVLLQTKEEYIEKGGNDARCERTFERNFTEKIAKVEGN